MTSMIPAMIAMSLVIIMVIAFSKQERHNDSAALAENMARYHQIVLNEILARDNTDTGVWTDNALEMGPLNKIVRWRSEVIADAADPDIRYLITYPSPSDYPIGSARFTRRDFAEIPLMLRHAKYDASAFGLWSDSAGVGGFNVTDSVLPSATTPALQPTLAEVFDNFMPILVRTVAH